MPIIKQYLNRSAHYKSEIKLKLKKTTIIILFGIYLTISFFNVTCSVSDSNNMENKNSLQNFPNSSVQNTIQMNEFDIKEEIIPIKIGDTTIKIVVNKSSVASPVYLYFNMHDNENTAVEATKEIINKYGGTLIELQADGQRLIRFSLNKKQYTFDPNRIFTEIGIKKTLNMYGDYAPEAQTEVSNFANKLSKDYFQNTKLLIAVHNNTDGNYSIKSYEKGQEFGNDAKLVYSNSDMDADDFFFVTEEKYYKILSENKNNVALQDNVKVTDDGSLSVYCGYKNISYINVESEHNHLKEQVKMLKTLQDLVKNL